MVLVGIGTPVREVSLRQTPAREVSSLSSASTPASKVGSMESNKRCLQRLVILRLWMPSDLLRALIVVVMAGWWEQK